MCHFLAVSHSSSARYISFHQANRTCRDPASNLLCILHRSVARQARWNIPCLPSYYSSMSQSTLAYPPSSTGLALLCYFIRTGHWIRSRRTRWKYLDHVFCPCCSLPHIRHRPATVLFLFHSAYLLSSPQRIKRRPCAYRCLALRPSRLAIHLDKHRHQNEWFYHFRWLGHWANTLRMLSRPAKLTSPCLRAHLYQSSTGLQRWPRFGDDMEACRPNYYVLVKECSERKNSWRVSV